jgi:hypothetical protein
MNSRSLGVVMLSLSLVIGCGPKHGPSGLTDGPASAIDPSLPKEAQAKQQVIRRILASLQEGYPVERLKSFVPGLTFRETHERFFEGASYLESWSFNSQPSGDEVPVALVFGTPGSGSVSRTNVDRTYLVRGTPGRYTVSRK